jgi:competence protein ComEA
MFELSNQIQWSNCTRQQLFSYIPYIGLGTGIVGLAYTCSVLFSVSNHTENTAIPSPDVCMTQSQVGTVVLYISGAVKKPGLYELESGKRVAQALEGAGGLLESADQSYVYQQLNLAEEVSDGQSIYVPFINAQTSISSSISKTTSNTVQSSKKVSINTATQSELEQLPKVGAVTAEKIIAQRPYQNLTELTEKKVLSQSTFNEIKELLSH